MLLFTYRDKRDLSRHVSKMQIKEDEKKDETNGSCQVPGIIPAKASAGRPTKSRMGPQFNECLKAIRLQ